MDLINLLKYQELDIKLRRILDVIEKSEEAKTIEQAKNEFSIAKKAVEDSEKAAGTLVDFFETAKKYFEDAEKKFSETTVKDSGEDAEEIGQFIEQMQRLKKRLTELEQKLDDKKNKSELVFKTYKDANAKGKRIRDIHTKAKEGLGKLRTERDEEMNALTQEMQKLEPKIDEELMKKYKALTTERKYPAFVEVFSESNTYSCRGCGIALSQKSSSILDEKNFCVCESCRRIIFKK